MRQFLLIVALALFLAGAPPGNAAESPSEYQIKAAYLYNFAKFVRWPKIAFKDAKAPLVIGVLGQNHFNGELTPLSLKTVRNRAIGIQHFKTLKDVNNCQLLYISPSEAHEMKTILKDLGTKPITTVGDSKNFARSGGVIQFVTKRGRLRFIINLDAAKANNIKIDAQLLSLAVKIQETGE